MADSSGGLNVAFLYDDSLDSTDGVAQYVKTLGGWLSDRGHQVSYLVGESKLENWRGGRVYSLSRNLRLAWGGNRLSMSLVPKIKLIKQVVRENKFDVVHVQVPYSPFMAQLVIDRLEPTTALVGTVHVLPANQLGSFGSRLLKILYGQSFKRIDELLSVSPVAKTYAKEVFGTDSIILPNVVNVRSFQSRRGSSRAQRQQIIFLGRLVKRKGCRQLLEAFDRLARALPDVKLIIAGEGPLRAGLVDYVRRHNLDSRVQFLGFVSEDQKPSLLATATIACFPSLYGESFGIVLIEAMAAGAQVVLGGDNAGYRSVLGERPELLVNPNDRVAFADRLHKLLTDEQLTEELHNWQIEEVKKYDVNLVGEKLLKIYDRTIAKRLKSRHNLG